jgi:hypothetical protein
LSACYPKAETYDEAPSDMPQVIPEGLTRDHVLRALAELDTDPSHPFGEPTGYELLHDGKRYAPKAVIGLAYRHLAGRILLPEEFSGGEARGQANHVLRLLGFTVVRKGWTIGPVSEDAIREEHDRRMGLWSRVLQAGGPTSVAPTRLRELGIYGGAQGIWVDKARTGELTPGGSGITVSVLHTGQSYADDLAQDCVIYHYPSTRRPPGRDRAEVEATKAAGRYGLPFFVITYPTPHATTRDVRLGWVEAWDDQTRTFLITFYEQPPVSDDPSPRVEEPFILVDEGERPTREGLARPGQQRFKFRVLKRYGPYCVVCGLNNAELLDAAHLRPKSESGSDDPRNGLVFCPTHHRAFDMRLFAIEPETLRVVIYVTGPDADRLGIVHHSLDHLENKPHIEALRWAWMHRQS